MHPFAFDTLCEVPTFDRPRFAAVLRRVFAILCAIAFAVSLTVMHGFVGLSLTRSSLVSFGAIAGCLAALVAMCRGHELLGARLLLGTLLVDTLIELTLDASTLAVISVFAPVIIVGTWLAIGARDALAVAALYLVAMPVALLSFAATTSELGVSPLRMVVMADASSAAALVIVLVAMSWAGRDSSEVTVLDVVAPAPPSAARLDVAAAAPLSAAQADAPAPAMPTRPSETSATRIVARRILVAEDEPALRALLARQLRQLGWDATIVPDGGAALALLAVDRAAFDVLLTDFMMPVLDGARLAWHARHLAETLPIILMSSDTGAAIRHLRTDGPPIRVLEKPFEEATLASALEASYAEQPDRRDGA